MGAEALLYALIYPIFYRGLEHLHFFVSRGGAGTNPHEGTEVQLKF